MGWLTISNENNKYCKSILFYLIINGIQSINDDKWKLLFIALNTSIAILKAFFFVSINMFNYLIANLSNLVYHAFLTIRLYSGIILSAS